VKRILNNLNIDGRLCDLVIEGGKITKMSPACSECEGENYGGAIAIPGLVDIHTHGCDGQDTMDAEFDKINKFLAKNGTTSYLATTMTMDYDSISKVMNADTSAPGAEILGFHMEGPYIADKYKGAQNGAFIKAPSIEEFESLPNIKMVTIAPELEGSMEFIKKCKAAVSLGHTGCSYDTAIEAIDAGALCLTHTFNAMPGIHHRNPGPIPAAAEKGIYVQIISDGLHIHGSVVKMIYKLFGADRMVLISDSMRATGLCDGSYEFGGQEIRVENSVARTLDGAIAGSTATLFKCVKTAYSFGIPFADAVKMATETPAKLIGVDGTKGRIAEGYDADIIILDRDLEISKVMVKGNFVD